MRFIKESRFYQPLGLILLGLITRFAWIWYPREVVFDEVHFGKYVEGYITGKYFFDIHPPLGKLIITLGAIIGGLNPAFDFNHIGEYYPDNTFIYLRFFPALFGSLLPVCIYYFVLSLKGSRTCAMFAGVAILLENALITQSRFILLDSIFLCIGFAGMTFYFYYRQNTQKKYFISAAGLLLGMAVSIKWTAVSFLGLVWIMSLADLIKIRFRLGESLRVILSLIILPVVVCFLIFSLHFALLDKSGPGDPFMTPRFKKSLKGSDSAKNPAIKELNNVEKFIEINRTMFYTNSGISTKHPDASKFYKWPLMIKPIYYWFGNNPGGNTSRIYLIGNPVIWIMAIISFILGIFLWKPEKQEVKIILYYGWIVNIMPFMNITRPLFLYHYFPALIFSIVIMSFFISSRIDLRKRKSLFIIGAIFIVILFGFLYYSPLTYGFPLSNDGFNNRLLLKAWK